MRFNPRIVSQIHRIGEVTDVLSRSETGKNAFNNTTSEWTKSHEIIAFRTYPNRNTEVQNQSGDFERDRPVFIIPKDDEDSTDDNKLPGDEDRLRYPSEDGLVYELQAPTHYRSHIEIFGEIVQNHPDN